MAADPNSDKHLVEKANAGDPAAFEALYRRHRDWVLGLAWRFTQDRDDALDILQETFAYLFDRFPGFELTSSMRSYLYPVVKHRCINLFRKRSKVVSLEKVRAEGLEGSVELGWGPEPGGDFARLVAQLPKEQAEVVRLRFALGMKLGEIAQAMDLALGTVKSRLHKALKSLRRNIEAEES